ENSLLVRYLARFGGAVPERIWEEIAWRACNRMLPTCGAFAAAWSRTEPTSKSFPRLVEKLRQDKGPLYIARLRRFFEPVPLASLASEQRVPAVTALELTRLYTENYSHGVPFDPGSLLDLWQRCGGNARLCERGAQAARRLLLGDAPLDADDWRVPEAEAADEA